MTMDAAWYEDLRGQLFSLLIAVEDRLGRDANTQNGCTTSSTWTSTAWRWKI